MFTRTRMDDRLLVVRVADVGGRTHLAWSEGMEICLPPGVAHATGLTGGIDARSTLRLPRGSIPLAPDEADALRERAAFTDRKPMPSRLPFSYHRLPAFVRGLAGRLIGQRQRGRANQWASFPRWPLDLSADFLADLASGRPGPFAGGPTPVVLTHDLDSAEGARNALRWFAPLEEKVGATSVHFVVPFDYPIDHGLLGQLQARGHEIGIHGYDHSNTTAFLDDRARRERLAASAELRRRYGCKGYRAPSLLRTWQLLHDLRDWYSYDSSIPTAGGLFPVPNNGCASARPFRVAGIAELPISMPRDGSLRFLGHSPSEILDIWKRCATQISRSGGAVVLLTHCERRFTGCPPMLRVYEEFLGFLASSGLFQFGRPLEVLSGADASVGGTA